MIQTVYDQIKKCEKYPLLPKKKNLTKHQFLITISRTKFLTITSFFYLSEIFISHIKLVLIYFNKINQ